MSPAEQRTGTLEALALGMAKLLLPLKDDLGNGKTRVLLAQLGLQLPASADGVSQFSDSVQTVVAEVSQMPQLVEDLIDHIDADDYGGILRTAQDLLRAVTHTVQGIGNISTAIRSMSAATGIDQNTLNEFAEQLPRKLLDYLIVRNLEYVPILPEVLEFVGVIERSLRNSGSPNPALPEYTEYAVNLDHIIGLMESPLDQLRELYDWGAPSFDGTRLLPVLQSLLGKAGIPSITDNAVSTPVLDVLFAELSAKTDAEPKGLLINVAQNIDIDRTIPYNQGGDWQIEAITGSNLVAQTSLLIQSTGGFIFTPPTAYATGEYGIRFTAERADHTAFIIFGQANASRLEVSKFLLEALTALRFDSGSPGAESSLTIRGKVSGGKLYIDMSGSDGFLSTILSGVKVNSDFELEFGYSSNDGVFFIGSSTLEIQLPLHVSLGPIDLNALTLSIGISADHFPIGVAVNMKAVLGPLIAVVEEIGIAANLRLVEDRMGGNLGPLNFDLGFKPPTGLGLSIDAGVVKGGGYLRFDPDKEEYDGILALDLAGIVSVTAIGLITTRMPDGSKGFSLLLIITAEFGTPIQLGFGFTLSGVGGLIGLNRTMRLEVIATGIRDGGINSIMFPQNVIENATRIISDLKNYFPPEEGTFLIGPMVKIGWGTPNLVTLSMGIIIEIPGNIAILGVLKIALPEESVALIVIQVSFIGAIEFDKNRLWFFASLFGSRILFMTLEGEMGLLVAWGDEPNFVVSVGGFHPAFNPPPLPFGAIARLAISILNTDFARIRVEAYFAVTSNSVQFGAAAELFFGVSAFNIEGHLAFDALFRFSPFYFIITISASLSVKVFGVGLFSVRMRGSLEGPTPWHVEGTGSISILFFDIDVDFSHTWGDEEETTLPAISVMPLLEAEFQKLENWLPVIPAGNRLLVSIRKIEPGTTDLILHPLGSLKISQRAVPLGLTIDKVGNQKPSDANHFNVTVTGFDERAEVKESFAIGQYLAKSDSELLSAKSFEPLKGGVDISISGEQYRAPLAVRRVVRYEKIIIDTYFKRFVKRLFPWLSTLFNLFLGGNATALSALSNKREKQLKPFDDRVQIGSTLYVVANSEDNSPYREDSVGFTSHAQAQDFLRQQIAADGNLAKQIHVIPQVEMQRTE